MVAKCSATAETAGRGAAFDCIRSVVDSAAHPRVINGRKINNVSVRSLRSLKSLVEFAAKTGEIKSGTFLRRYSLRQ